VKLHAHVDFCVHNFWNLFWNKVTNEFIRPGLIPINKVKFPLNLRTIIIERLCNQSENVKRRKPEVFDNRQTSAVRTRLWWMNLNSPLTFPNANHSSWLSSLSLLNLNTLNVPPTSNRKIYFPSFPLSRLEFYCHLVLLIASPLLLRFSWLCNVFFRLSPFTAPACRLSVFRLSARHSSHVPPLFGICSLYRYLGNTR
jgi:hypothetical protein